MNTTKFFLRVLTLLIALVVPCRNQNTEPAGGLSQPSGAFALLGAVE